MKEARQTTPSAQAAVAEWLQPVPWQLFATLEFLGTPCQRPRP